MTSGSGTERLESMGRRYRISSPTVDGVWTFDLAVGKWQEQIVFTIKDLPRKLQKPTRVKTHGKIFRYNIKLNHQNWDHCNENAEMTNKGLGQSLPLDPSVVELAIAKNIGYSRDILVVELGK